MWVYSRLPAAGAGAVLYVRDQSGRAALAAAIRSTTNMRKHENSLGCDVALYFPRQLVINYYQSFHCGDQMVVTSVGGTCFEFIEIDQDGASRVPPAT